MPQFALICRDKADSLELRMDSRPAHLEFIKTQGNAVLLAGPMLDENGAPKGSILIIEATDEAHAKKIAESDPYAKAGLFQSVLIEPYRVVTGALTENAK